VARRVTALRSVRRWLARAVVLGAVAASLHGAYLALTESRRTFRYGRRHAGESLVLAQDRLFGRDYMASLRSVRSRVGPQRTLLFVDELEQDGSTYFALHYLAPRRLVRFGSTDDLERWRFDRRLPARPTVVLVVPGALEPVRLVQTPERRRRRERVRQARP
jgi:hypothetical protein